MQFFTQISGFLIVFPYLNYTNISRTARIFFVLYVLFPPFMRKEAFVVLPKKHGKSYNFTLFFNVFGILRRLFVYNLVQKNGTCDPKEEIFLYIKSIIPYSAVVAVFSLRFLNSCFKNLRRFVPGAWTQFLYFLAV